MFSIDSLGKEIIMLNERDYRAIKKGMKEHITATVIRSDGSRKSWAKLSTGKWAAVKDNGDLDGFAFRPEDFYDLLCIFWDSGKLVVFNDHSAV